MARRRCPNTARAGEGIFRKIPYGKAHARLADSNLLLWIVGVGRWLHWRYSLLTSPDNASGTADLGLSDEHKRFRRRHSKRHADGYWRSLTQCKLLREWRWHSAAFRFTADLQCSEHSACGGAGHDGVYSHQRGRLRNGFGD